MNDINHPSHYNQGERKECIVEMQELFGVRFVIDFCIGNCYKYLYRRGQKTGNTYDKDTDKAIWYYKSQLQILHRIVLASLQYILFFHLDYNVMGVKFHYSY